MSEFVEDDGLSRIATMLNGHGEEAWFDLPFDQEIEVEVEYSPTICKS